MQWIMMHYISALMPFKYTLRCIHIVCTCVRASQEPGSWKGLNCRVFSTACGANKVKVNDKDKNTWTDSTRTSFRLQIRNTSHLKDQLHQINLSVYGHRIIALSVERASWDWCRATVPASQSAIFSVCLALLFSCHQPVYCTETTP